MEHSTIGELRCREVINVCSGERLGFVSDVRLDLCNGCAEALVVPRHARCFGLLGHEDDCIIPWNAIRSIGEDLILVELAETCCKDDMHSRKKSEKSRHRF